MSVRRLMRPLTARRFLALAFLFAAAWQLGVFAVAGVCRVAGAGVGRPELSKGERRFVSSLLAPDDAALKESLHEVGRLRETHASSVAVWHEALARMLAGEETEAVLSELEARGPKSPHFYDGHTRRILSDFSRRTRAELFLTAASYGHADDAVLRALEEFPLQGSPSENLRREAADARLLTLILRERFDEALEFLGTRSDFYFKEQDERSAPALRVLRDAPGDFAARLALAEALYGFAGSGRLAVGYTSLCWKLWDAALAPAEKSAALHLLARVYEEGQGYTTARLFYTAAARMLSAGGGFDAERPSALLARLAKLESERGGELDGEREPGSPLLAAEIYGEVTQRFPDTEGWVESLYERGALLRKAGYSVAAEKVLTSLLKSEADDTGPNVTAVYQNYRGSAAREIARSYADRGNFPLAYYWQYKATVQYPFIFECGSGLRAYEWREKRDLFLSSVKAGPLFIAAHWLLALGG